MLSQSKRGFPNFTNIVFLKEPVDEWEKVKDENGDSLLGIMKAFGFRHTFGLVMKFTFGFATIEVGDLK